MRSLDRNWISLTVCTPHRLHTAISGHKIHQRRYVQLSHNHGDLLNAGITESRIESTRVDLRNRIRAVRAGALAWGVFTVRKPANARTLVVGAGPLGSLVAMRLNQSGVANVTLKVLPTVAQEVVQMVTLAGVAVVEDWADIADSNWGSVIVATKTHWLPQIALEMSCAQVRQSTKLSVALHCFWPQCACQLGTAGSVFDCSPSCVVLLTFVVAFAS